MVLSISKKSNTNSKFTNKCKSKKIAKKSKLNSRFKCESITQKKPAINSKSISKLVGNHKLQNSAINSKSNTKFMDTHTLNKKHGLNICPRKSSSLVVALSGVPSTGKTTLAKKWCLKFGWQYVSLNDVVNKNRLYTKIDLSDGAKVVDLKKLNYFTNRIISKIRKKNNSAIIEGHLVCEIKLNVDKIIILRLDPNIIAKRLSKRSYSKQKINQNIESECLDYCTIIAQKNYAKNNIYEIDMTKKSTTSTLNSLRNIIFCKNKKTLLRMLASNSLVNWSKYLLKL